MEADLRPAEPESAGRPLRPDLRLQRGRPAAGPARLRQRPDQAGLIQGFIVLDHFNQAAEAGAEIGGLMADGKIKGLETVVEGFERLPDALNMLFDGANTGKLSVKIWVTPGERRDVRNATPRRISAVSRVSAYPRSPKGVRVARSIRSTERSQPLDQLRRLVDLEVARRASRSASPASRGCRRRCGTRRCCRRSARPCRRGSGASRSSAAGASTVDARLVARGLASGSPAATNAAGSVPPGSAPRLEAHAGRGGAIEPVDAEGPPVRRGRGPRPPGTSGARR